MGSLSICHWLIVLLVVAMVFGTSKLKNLGKDLGAAVKGFREGSEEASREEPSLKSLKVPSEGAQKEKA